MDVWGITLATLRRWYVFLPIIAVAGLLAYAAGLSSAPEYEATGTAMYTPARLTPDRSSQSIANPFVSEDGANGAITVILNGPDTAATLAKRGLDGTATTTAASRSPIFTVRALASDPETAIAIVNEVMTIASDELVTRQRDAGIDQKYMIGLQELAPASIKQVDNNTAIRVQAVILVLGAVVGVSLAVLSDDIVGLVRRRRQRRRGGDVTPVDDTEPGTAPDIAEDTVAAETLEDEPETGTTERNTDGEPLAEPSPMVDETDEILEDLEESGVASPGSGR